MVHKGRVFSELKARSEVRVPFKQDAVTWALQGASRLLWGHPGFDSNVDPQSCGPEHLSKKESKGLSLRLQVPLGEHGPQKQLSRGRVGSRRLKRQSPGLHGSQLDLCTHAVVVSLGVSVGLLTMGEGVSLTLLPARRTLVLLLGHFVQL